MQDWMKLAGIRSSEITDESVFRKRRQLLQAAGAAGLTGAIAADSFAMGEKIRSQVNEELFKKLVLLFFLVMGLNIIRRGLGY